MNTMLSFSDFIQVLHSIEIKYTRILFFHLFGNIEPLPLQSLYIIIGVVGGVILLTLIYVSFRKFHGEKRAMKKNQLKDSEND